MKVSTCTNRPVLNPCDLKDLDHQVDPYIGCQHYCYYCYALNQAETDWSREILIHEDITRQLEDELTGIPPQTIYMGWHTDPYQPCEAEHQQTRRVLELLLERGFSASILTKSDLVLRDMDLLQRMPNASVSTSVAFPEDARQVLEADTIPTERRIAAIQRMAAAGIKTSALICPVIPYITDARAFIETLAPHTEVIWIYGLSIQDRSEQNWLNVQRILDCHFAHLKDQIEAAIFSADHPYWIQLRQDLEAIKDQQDVEIRIHV